MGVRGAELFDLLIGTETNGGVCGDACQRGSQLVGKESDKVSPEQEYTLTPRHRP